MQPSSSTPRRITGTTMLLAAVFTAFLPTLVVAAPAPAATGAANGTCTLASTKSVGDVIPVPPASNSSSSGNLTDVVATGWYAGWLGEQLPPSNISWSKYSALTFAFATTTPDPSVIALDDQSADLLPTFVSEAHCNNVDALLSIGGWTGSQYFSSAVDSPENRTIFVKAVVDLAKKYELDGIDFDWEYPNHQGIGCNVISANDTANFLSFLQELREDPTGADLILTVAAGITPFAGPDGEPMSDVSAFAEVIDHVAIMNYDIWGSWSDTVGPNAPLNDTCASVQAGSAVSAVKAWTEAKFPASQLVLGVAAYGHSFSVDKSTALDSSNTIEAYPQFNKAKQPLGDEDVPGAAPSVDQCGNTAGPGGNFNFNGMIAAGFLNATTGKPEDGIDYRFDNCSQTAYVYNATSQVMISYDDATSFAAKGEFINAQGLAGFAIWQIAGDSNDILLDAISEAMEITDCPGGDDDDADDDDNDS